MCIDQTLGGKHKVFTFLLKFVKQLLSTRLLAGVVSTFQGKTTHSRNVSAVLRRYRQNLLMLMITLRFGQYNNHHIMSAVICKIYEYDNDIALCTMIVSVRREHSVSGPTMWCRLHCLHSIFIDQTLRTGQLPGLPSSLPAVSPVIFITELGRMFTVNNYYNIKHFKYDVKTRSYRSRLSR